PPPARRSPPTRRSSDLVDQPVLLEDLGQPREALHRRIGARVLVSLEAHRLALPPRKVHGHQFVREAAGLVCLGPTLLREHGERVDRKSTRLNSSHVKNS